jgi:hypothetical protein
MMGPAKYDPRNSLTALATGESNADGERFIVE